MKRSLSAGVALAALALLVGCTTGPTTDSSTSAPPPGAGGGEYENISPYYPVALGNTWTYRMNYPDPVGVITETEEMTAVTPEGDDVRVTIERSFHYENGSSPDFSDSVEYIFHADGSLSVPYQSIPDNSGADVEIHDGELVWPTTAEFEAGTPKTGVINLTVTAGGASFDQVINFTITGQGVESVTVPAGTYEARKLLQSMRVSIPSAGVNDLPIDATVWLAEGVGQVKSEVPDLLGSGSPITVELLEFTPGG